LVVCLFVCSLDFFHPIIYVFEAVQQQEAQGELRGKIQLVNRRSAWLFVLFCFLFFSFLFFSFVLFAL
jgi:hypothetical protein